MDPQIAAGEEGGGVVARQIPPKRLLWSYAADNSLESISILCTHHIVQHRIKCGREEVEAAREIEEILIDSSVEGQVLEVDIAKTLEVEGSPGDKEENNNRNYQEVKSQ